MKVNKLNPLKSWNENHTFQRQILLLHETLRVFFKLPCQNEVFIDAPDTQHPFSRHLPGLPRLNASDLKVLEDLPNTMVGWFGNRSWHHDMIFLEAVMISKSYTYFCQVIECEHQKSKRVVSNQWEVVSIEGPLVIEQHPLEDWTFPKSLRAAQALLLSPKPQIRRSGWYNLDFRDLVDQPLPGTTTKPLASLVSSGKLLHL